MDTRERLLEQISNWSTEDVVDLLQKNDLSECCDAVVKRQVDGEGLLRISEGNFTLRDSDLLRSLRWRLCEFVEKLNNNPKQYLTEDNIPPSSSLDESNFAGDFEEWDTDFEDDDRSALEIEDSSDSQDSNDSPEMHANHNSWLSSRDNSEISGNNELHLPEENDNIYANKIDTTKSPESPVGAQTNLVASLKEKLRLKEEEKNKPSLCPKPKVMKKKPEIMALVKNKLTFVPLQVPSNLNINPMKMTPSPEATQSTEARSIQQLRKVPFPPKPKYPPPIAPALDQKSRKLPKPPSSPLRIGHLDLVADLPTSKSEDSDDDDYEPIKRPLTEHLHLSSDPITSPSSSGSLGSGRSIQGSRESLHPPSIATSDADNQDVYEIINEKVLSLQSDDRTSYVMPISKRLNSQTLPLVLQSRSSKKKIYQERSDQSRFYTCPHSGQTSRPLPLLPPDNRKNERPAIPEKNFEAPPSYQDQPWFHNIGREEAIALITGGSSKFSNTPIDGYFLVRPSNAKMDQPWTLVLWYKNKTYNIAVRKRSDSRYALGKVKHKEQSFGSIEELVTFYKEEELVLSGSGDVSVGSTRLTETPAKKKD